MQLAIVADTHLPRGKRRLPQACVQRLRAADLILHAGDLSTVDVLRMFEALGPPVAAVHGRSEEHTSELQSHSDLVCRLLLEKKKKTTYPPTCLYKKKRQIRL